MVGNRISSLNFWWRQPDIQLTDTETWDGTNWTEVNDLNTAKEI